MEPTDRDRLVRNIGIARQLLNSIPPSGQAVAVKIRDVRSILEYTELAAASGVLLTRVESCALLQRLNQLVLPGPVVPKLLPGAGPRGCKRDLLREAVGHCRRAVLAAMHRQSNARHFPLPSRRIGDALRMPSS